jgi:nucleotide-binding universal stress UspA family protein
LEKLFARLQGRSIDLLAYEDVRARLAATEQAGEHIEEIPLDAIVGSVGRYSDFTRSFLPRRDSDAHRWASLKSMITGARGLPPIQVYSVGEAYFVRDGNHRVSIARDMGATHIQAYVTDVRTQVPLTPDVQPDDLILKAEQVDFLQATDLGRLRPESDLSLTVPGGYSSLEEHIRVHRYFMGLDLQREIPYPHAVAHWYDEVYLPVVYAIRALGLLREFPERTEADLYLWISAHRAALAEQLGWHVAPEAAVTSWLKHTVRRPGRVADRLWAGISAALTPDELEAGPAAGTWRQTFLAGRRTELLFADVLVALDGTTAGYAALDQAIRLAQLEGSRLLGLHVLADRPGRNAPDADELQERFNAACQQGEVSGAFVLDRGAVDRTICRWAAWVDLVVVSLSHPPSQRPLGKLNSGFRTLLRRIPRPTLAVPGASSRLQSAALAYDGSAKAKEGLYICAHLSPVWDASLVVMCVAERGFDADEARAEAKAYLDKAGVEAHYPSLSGPVPEAILGALEAQGCDFLVLGGYGRRPVSEVLLGSAVDQMLIKSTLPLLICR